MEDTDESIDPCGSTAYIRYTFSAPNWEFCDALGHKMSEEWIWVDQDKRTLSQRLEIVQNLMTEHMSYQKSCEDWAKDMRAWRIRRRLAELEFWRHQAAAQNWTIFNPIMCMPKRWQDLYEGLRLYVDTENERDQNGGYANTYQGHPSSQMVDVSLEETVAIEMEYSCAHHPQKRS